MIDEALYKPAVVKYCTNCGTKLNTTLVDYGDEPSFSLEDGKPIVVWRYTCPNKTKKWRDSHLDYKSIHDAYPETIVGKKPKVLYDIIIYYRVQATMEQQIIIDTESSGGRDNNEMKVFYDTVNNKFIEFNKVDILRIDTTEKKQN